MKRHVSVLALCLSGIAIAQAQTNTMPTTSGTTTTGTYTTTPATTSNMNNSMNTTTTTDASMNNTGATNSTNNATAPAYGTTTTSYNNADMKRTNEYDDTKEGRFGAYVGANFSRFRNEPIPDGAYRAGFQVGVYGRTAGTIFGQLGVEYRNSTANLVRNANGATRNGKIDQHFIAIPAYVGARLGTSLGLRLQVGAELSALVVNAKNDFLIGDDDVKRTILAGLAGVGLNLGPVTVDAVYNLGLTNVFAANDTKRTLLALNLGFRF